MAALLIAPKSIGRDLWLRVWILGTIKHWYNNVLNKRFLTPFHDDIWNRRQVSVCDRVSFPHDPETVWDMEK